MSRIILGTSKWQPMNHNQGSSSENAKQCASKGKDTFCSHSRPYSNPSTKEKQMKRNGVGTSEAV